MTVLRASLVIVGLLCTAGCKKEGLEGSAPPAAKPAAPGASATPASPSAGALVGTIVERLDAPNYTYLRLKGATEDTWAAVPTTQVAVGTRVSITNPMPMQNFESKTLGRTFQLVMFGGSAEVLGEDGVAGLGGTALPANPHAGELPPRPAAPAVDLSNIKVAKATGPDGRTVAEIYAQRAQLKDKTATVRGKVVKVTGGVLGHNWLHLRDGSGTDAAQDNDLIVTTTATAQVNDEVTAQGVVHTDKDLGSGYSYKVLMEDAKIIP